MTVRKSHVFTAAVFSAFVAAGASFAASEHGTEAEATALLDRALVELKGDQEAAIAKFNDPKVGFQDRDLYVFCANLGDGIIVAHANIAGTDLRTLKDSNGKPFGTEMLDTATEGQITEIEYMWPRPSGGDPVDKISRITKVGDLMCGVGYYKP
jgi:signal transduction histidine kinase